MRTRTARAIAIATVAGITLVACGGDDEDTTGEATAEATVDAGTAEATADAAAPTAEATAPAATDAPAGTGAPAGGTIVDVALGAGTFNTLIAAAQAAGLAETLAGPGPLTVFAPTDEAFAAALESLGLTAEELLADTETLQGILTYHVVSGEVPASQVVTMDGQGVATVNGAEVTISVDGDAVMVNEANVTQVDIAASNGIIHVIDAVLLPPE